MSIRDQNDFTTMRRRIGMLVGLNFLIGGAFVAMVVGGWASPGDRSVDADRITIRDAAGRARITLSVADDGKPRIELLDDGGVVVARLASIEGGNELVLHGTAGESAKLTAASSGAALNVLAPYPEAKNAGTAVANAYLPSSASASVSALAYGGFGSARVSVSDKQGSNLLSTAPRFDIDFSKFDPNEYRRNRMPIWRVDPE